MNIKLYQINPDRDHAGTCFESLADLERRGETVQPELYDKVFEGTVDCSDLEAVFQIFNLNRPDEFRGRSMSVSDVVSVEDETSGEERFYFCDSVGFQEIAFDARKAQDKSDNTITVVLVEPGRKPRISEIENTLEGYYQAIGTDIIQAVYPFDEPVCLVCDEEGKLKGAPLNRALRYEDTKEIYDVVAGTFFVCSCKGSRFGSLDADEQRRYLSRYQWPEAFLRLNGEIVSIPIRPHDRSEAR